MPQLFNVLRCFNCSTYQVDIHKTSTNKWTCKLCGSKQSLKQIFFQGESKECREKVQLLNGHQIESKNQRDDRALETYEMRRQMEEERSVVDEERSTYNSVVSSNNKKTSKWSKYLDSDDEEKY